MCSCLVLHLFFFFFFCSLQGTLDIMVLQSAGSGTAARNVQLIRNNYFNDAFFLKGLGKLQHEIV